jgi:hypothetical protein
MLRHQPRAGGLELPKNNNCPRSAIADRLRARPYARPRTLTYGALDRQNGGINGSTKPLIAKSRNELIQLTVTAIAGAVGIWLFYVQHQFEGVHWARGKDWDYTSAALQGSSFYKLPRVLQWFTGNIGFHHIHHLNPRIANYNLQRCHDADPYFRRIKPVTLLASFKSLTYRLWDEQRHQFVGFRH